MSIIRVNKTDNYTVMSNEHLRDKRLSLKAKGLMSEMLSLPDDWDYSVAGLARINKESASAIETALKELKEAGYLVVTKLTPDRTESGRFEYEYDLYERPQKQEGEKQGVEKQGVEILPLEIQGVENRPQINTKELNTEKQNKEEINKESLEEVLLSVDYICESEELQEAYRGFIEMRKKIKKPLTARAWRMIIKRTQSLAGDDIRKMEEILGQSVRNDWQDVYPLKEDETFSRLLAGGTSAQSRAARVAANPFTALLEEET